MSFPATYFTSDPPGMVTEAKPRAPRKVSLINRKTVRVEIMKAASEWQVPITRISPEFFNDVEEMTRRNIHTAVLGLRDKKKTLV